MREAIGEGAGGKVKVRGTAGIMKDLERRQKSRETRSQRDVLDRALTDLAAFYRDVLLLQTRLRRCPLVHGDLSDQLAGLPSARRPSRRCAGSRRCWPAVSASPANVAVLLAVEEMTLALAAG